MCHWSWLEGIPMDDIQTDIQQEDQPVRANCSDQLMLYIPFVLKWCIFGLHLYVCIEKKVSFTVYVYKLGKFWL